MKHAPLSSTEAKRAERRHDDELQQVTHCSSSGRSILAAILRGSSRKVLK
jgi:hypothetical protein